MSTGAVVTGDLISHRFKLEACDRAYSLILSGEPSLGVLLEYDNDKPLDAKIERTKSVASSQEVISRSASQFGFIGAGSFAGAVLPQHLKGEEWRCTQLPLQGCNSCTIAKNLKPLFHLHQPVT